MQLIIGLGNPGRKYADTWHNLGFMAIDRFASKHDLSFKAGKGKYYTASGFVNFKKVILVKPTTYMNLSGIAVSSILDYFGISPQQTLIIYDDININLGNVRMRLSGSAGGHNGIKSIISSLDTMDFPRLRMGFRTEKIASVLQANPKVLPDIVLSKFPSKLYEDIDILVNKTVEAVESLLENGIEKTMNIYNEKNN